jgi:hypothetical protein
MVHWETPLPAPYTHSDRAGVRIRIPVVRDHGMHVPGATAGAQHDVTAGESRIEPPGGYSMALGR